MSPPTGPGSPPGTPPGTPPAPSPVPPSLSTDILDLEQRIRRVSQSLAEVSAESTKIKDEISDFGLGRAIVDYEKLLELKIEEREINQKFLETELQKLELLEKQRKLEDDGSLASAIAIDNARIAVEDKQREIEATKNKVKELGKELKKLKPGFEIGGTAAKKMFEAIGVKQNSFSNLFEQLNDFQGGVAGFVKSVGSGFFKDVVMAGPTILSSVVSQSYDLMKKMNDVFADTKKEFGVEYGQRLNNVFMKSERSLRQYGISADETVAISKTLNGVFSDFIDMGGEEQKILMKNAAIMQKVGVSNEEYADSLKFLEFSMGETREATQENIAELVEFGRRNGIEGKSTIANFKKVRSYMSQFGDNWQKTFNRMSLISRKTGMDIQDLASIAQGFDSFDSAATSVGQLNALLGGPFLNTVEMIRTEDPAEQIMKVKQAFDAAGKSVNSMSKYELKGFAESIPGINGDVEKMRNLLNKLDTGMLSSADDLTKALEETDEQKKLDDQLKASRSIAESLAVVSNSLAMMTPLLEVFTPLFQGLASVATALGDAFPRVALGIGKSITYFVRFITKVAKGVPILGTIISAFQIADRFSRGDYAGAALELGAAGAAYVPGLGFAAQAGMAAYDASGGEKYMSQAFGYDTPKTGYGVDDFIYRGDGVNGSITPINSKDQFLGLKDGGPAQAGLKEVMEGISKGNTSYQTSTSIQNKTESDFVRNNINNASNNITPNINLTVMLEGRELRAFVKQVIADNLNPLK